MGTKGKWEVEINPFPLPRSQGSFIGYIRSGGKTIAQLVGDSPALEANAHLIAAAVNASIKINPANPMAVAESIGDMYEDLETALGELAVFNPGDGRGVRYLTNAEASINKTLAKAEAAPC